MSGHPPGTISPAPSEDHLRELEAWCGIVLPADYRAFLAHANGCIPLRRRFRLGSTVKSIKRFLPILQDGLGDEGEESADLEVVAARLGARLATDPDGDNIALIPIAALFAGDFLVLDYRQDPNDPSIAVWDHEASTDFNPAVEMVCASFSEFLDKLEA